MGREKDMVRFFIYSRYHGKIEPVGSDYIRAIQLINNWPDADLYKYGENPEVLIFNKVFISQDYQFPRNFKGIKILDICDPMWAENFNVVETAQAMDAVTCPTENLAEFIRQFHSNVIVVPDRFDLNLIPNPRKHSLPAKTVVWYGYAHNSVLMKPVMKYLDEFDLDLLFISNDDTFLHTYSTRTPEFYTFKRYDEKTIYQDLQMADFAILPEGFRPEDRFKSNNKTIRANLAGLPVARTPEEVEAFLNPKNRQQWVDTNYAIIREEYDILKSIEQYKEIIHEIKN